VYETANGKAYEMLSNLVGVLRLYKLTGDTNYLKTCLIAWDDIRTKRLYITGTTSSHEHFQEAFYLPFENSDQMGEGCVTTTWIQFSLDLFRATGDSRFMDEVERSVYNHLPAAENPQSGCVSYYTALSGKKPHSCALGSSCCLSSVPRGISYIPQMIWGNYGGGIGVFQYSEGSVKDSFTDRNGKKVSFELKIKTNYPESGKVVIEPGFSEKGDFPVFLRVPSWTNSFTATFLGKVYKGTLGTMLKIAGNWKPGDKIEVDIDMSVQVIPGHGEFANLVAFQRGPQVLALDSSLNEGMSIQQMPILIGSHPHPTFRNYTGKFPDRWVGNQAFILPMGDKMKPLIFTPFELAGQMGTAVKVWFSNK
jgi:DUF1680 family protein